MDVGGLEKLRVPKFGEVVLEVVKLVWPPRPVDPLGKALPPEAAPYFDMPEVPIALFELAMGLWELAV
jgi:hypothetical protein